MSTAAIHHSCSLETECTLAKAFQNSTLSGFKTTLVGTVKRIGTQSPQVAIQRPHVAILRPQKAIKKPQVAIQRPQVAM